MYAYILWFSPLGPPVRDSKLRHVNKEYWAGGRRAGGIVRLDSIKFPCPLAPVLEGPCDPAITANSCYELVDSFYLNCFSSHAV
jgi:hypothetical protein